MDWQDLSSSLVSKNDDFFQKCVFMVRNGHPVLDRPRYTWNAEEWIIGKMGVSFFFFFRKVTAKSVTFGWSERGCCSFLSLRPYRTRVSPLVLVKTLATSCPQLKIGKSMSYTALQASKSQFSNIFWSRLQRKVFSRWVNQKLVLTRGIKIDDIVEAAADRTLLLNSSEAHTTIGKFWGKPETVSHFLTSLSSF